MKILQISPIIGSGSVGRIVDQLYHGLIAREYQCLVITGQIGNTSIPNRGYIKTVNKYSRVLNAIHARIFDSDGFCPFIKADIISNKISDFNPDIIHIHGGYGYYMNIEPIFNLINKYDYKVVNTLHSCWDFTGHCCYYSYAGCERWRKGCYDCPEKREYPTSWFKDNADRNYMIKKSIIGNVNKQIIVTPSQWMAHEVKKSFLGKYPVEVIHNGIDVHDFKRIDQNEIDCYEKYRIPKNKIIILGVAVHWDKRKGLNDFFELLDNIDEDMHIVIVGLNKKAKIKKTNKITIIKRTENKRELAELYSIATILYNPTYEDNYPTVNLEAIACETPIVTYDSGGSKEAVIKYSFGHIVEKKDYAEIIKIAREYDNIKPVMEDWIQKDINSERMIEDYINLYDRLCERK